MSASQDGEKTYRVVAIKSALKDIKKINKGSAKKDLHAELKARLEHNPFDHGKSLRDDLYPARRLRIGSFRVIYLPVEQERKVYLLSVRHRQDVYEDPKLRKHLRELLRPDHDE